MRALTTFLLWGILPFQHDAFVTRTPSAWDAFAHARHPSSTLFSAESTKEYSIRDSWALIVLGDLHLEDDMTAHNQARKDCLATLRDLSLMPSVVGERPDQNNPPLTVHEILNDIKDARAGDLTAAQLEMLLAQKRDGDFIQSFLVSLGDLGRKDIRHEPGDAGTTKSFQDAKDFLDGFGLPYELVSGNHDLEGLDEFDTDEANLKAWMDCFDKPTPQFCRQIGEKTLLVGLSTVRFRDSPHSSHEVHVDDAQLEWFLQTIEAHQHSEGWKIIVFSHAPIMGSGLRVLQNVHVINGCAWLNHCSENRLAFIRCVQQNPQIKLWFSGHFHLSHDFEDSVCTVGSCSFVQVGVIGPASTRDGKRQTRIVRGCNDRLQVYTINHHERESTGDDDDQGSDRATVRLDIDVDIATGQVIRSPSMAEEGSGGDSQTWFQVYTPRDEDGCYIESPDGSIADPSSVDSKVCWWHMKDRRVIGLHQGQLVEYDQETLSPLGIVVNKKALGNREVYVVENGTALVLVDEATKDIEVVHPNDDGSYWRKYQRNKRIRQEEKAREAIARMWLEKKR